MMYVSNFKYQDTIFKVQFYAFNLNNKRYLEVGIKIYENLCFVKWGTWWKNFKK